MSHFLEGTTTRQNQPVKRFGYLLSAIFLILANLSLIFKWPATPWLFIITMYLLTGSLWIPLLIKPLYIIFGKYVVKDNLGDQNFKDQQINNN